MPGGRPSKEATVSGLGRAGKGLNQVRDGVTERSQMHEQFQSQQAVIGAEDTGAKDVVGLIIKKKCGRCQNKTADHFDCIFSQFNKEISVLVQIKIRSGSGSRRIFFSPKR